MSLANAPKPGQVFTRAGLSRLVVSVNPQGDKPGGCYVEWRRPANDWKTYSMYLPSWLRWASSAVTAN
jgi:hypothetical protein